MIVCRWSAWLDVAWAISLGIAYLAVQYLWEYFMLCFVLGYASLGFVYFWFIHEVYGKSETKTTCSICLEEVEDEEFVWCSRCKKTYHTPCAQEWYKQRLDCPTCRKYLGLMGILHWPFNVVDTLHIGAILAGIYFVSPLAMLLCLPIVRLMIR
jgi:hypothetical protein